LSEDLEKVFKDFKEDVEALKSATEDLKKTVEDATKRLTDIESNVELVMATVEEDYREFMEKCMEEGKTMKQCAREWREKQRLYEEPYGKPTEEQYEAPAIAKTLRYLKRILNDRQFKHVLRLLGVGQELADVEVESIKIEEPVEKAKVVEALKFVKSETDEKHLNRVLGFLGIEEEIAKDDVLTAVLPSETSETQQKKLIEATYETLMKERTWGEEVVCEEELEK